MQILRILPLGQLDVAHVDEEGVVVEFLPAAIGIVSVTIATTTAATTGTSATASLSGFFLHPGPTPVLAGGHDLLHHLVPEHGVVEEAVVGTLVAVHRPLAGVVAGLGGLIFALLALAVAIATAVVQGLQPTDLHAPHVFGLEIVEDRPVVLAAHPAGGRRGGRQITSTGGVVPSPVRLALRVLALCLIIVIFVVVIAAVVSLHLGLLGILAALIMTSGSVGQLGIQLAQLPGALRAGAAHRHAQVGRDVEGDQDGHRILDGGLAALAL